MNKKVSTWDLLWYMGGLMLFGFTSLIYMIIVTRFVGIEAAGKFTFAFAVACTFYYVGVYFGKSFQITDTSNKYSDSDYIYNRITTCIIMMILTLLFCLIMGYGMDKTLLILALTVYRGADACVEGFHAIVQKKDRVYKVGVSIFFKTLLFVFAFLLSIIIFKDIIIASLVIMVLNIMYLLLVDYNIAKKSMVITKYENNKNIKLLIEGFSVFLFSFLAIYVNSASKYAIDSLSTDTIQGIFGIIFMPSSFVALISLYLVQPFLGNISELLKEKNIRPLNKLLIKLTLAVFGIGVLSIAAAYLLGIPVLELLYGIKLDNQLFNLLIILLGSIFYSIYSIYSQVLIAMRKNSYQVIVLAILFVISFITSRYLVGLYDINGASYAYLIVMSILMIFTISGYIYYSNKLKKPKDR